MKVIGAGFGRTGTNSLQIALIELGFGPCYHMNELFKRPEHADLWLEAMNTGRMDWERILSEYGSGVDFPVEHFYRELMAQYPHAKVVLTVREPEKWYRSAKETIYAISHVIPMRWIGQYMPKVGKIFRLTRIVWDRDFDGRFLDQAHAIAVFERHNEEVKANVPPERLLVFDVREGWEPLCRFLEVPVPTKPFPHVNDTAEFRQRVNMVRWMGWAIVGIPTAAILGLIAWLL